MTRRELRPAPRRPTVLALWATCALGLAMALGACTSPSAQPTGAIVHSVYFELRDPGQARALAAACERRLGSIPGILSLSAGPREASQERATNDQRFDVGLTILFADRAALEAYLVHPVHLALVEEYQAALVGLRVFDTAVQR